MPECFPCIDWQLSFLMFSAEALYALYKHDGYYSSRINVNMHLLISLTQKQI